MAILNFDSPDSTGHEFFKRKVATCIYAFTRNETKIEVTKENKPIWLSGRKNKRDNFKLK